MKPFQAVVAFGPMEKTRKRRSVLWVCLLLLASLWIYGCVVSTHYVSLYYSGFNTNKALFMSPAVEFPWRPLHVDDVDCSKLFAGDKEELRLSREIKRSVAPDDDIVDEVMQGCDVFLSKYSFINSYLTTEERNFPLAYSIITYKHAHQVRRLLQSIYRPQNFICIHVDEKSDSSFRRAVQLMSSCLDNVFLSSRSVSVVWGNFSVLETELICMEDLLKYRGWKYFINLTGQEFPLKTNLQIVSVLSTDKWRRRWANHLPAPHHLTLHKGPVHSFLNRHFVHYVTTNPIARDFREWCRETRIPDETFFPTLNHNPQLAIPGSYDGPHFSNTTHKPDLVRFKNWEHIVLWPCAAGKYMRGICMLSSGDLPLLGERPELFANKFDEGRGSAVAAECLAERLYNLTRQGVRSLDRLDMKYYQTLPYLNHIIQGDETLRVES